MREAFCHKAKICVNDTYSQQSSTDSTAPPTSNCKVSNAGKPAEVNHQDNGLGQEITWVSNAGPNMLNKAISMVFENLNLMFGPLEV